MITVITFAHSIGITALAFVKERIEGSLDRIFASGVSSTSVTCGHFITHSAVLLCQTGIMLAIVIFAFKIHVEGNFVYVVTLLLLLGFCWHECWHSY